MLRTLSALACLALAAGAGSAGGAAAGMPGHAHGSAPASGTRCAFAALACATAVTPHVDSRGRLWLAWVANGIVSVARSSDLGRTFSATVMIGKHGALLDAGADAKPQLLIDGKGRVIVAYGVFKDQKYNAQVMIATSEDDGATFSTPRSLSAHDASQRFPALALDGRGGLLVVWLDKRTAAENRSQGMKQAGAALAFARSLDGGRSFGVERIAQDRTCECCRVALAVDATGKVQVLFRAIFDDRERDHAVLAIGANGEVGQTHRVAEDHWAIDACPHHGPSIAIGADGVLHAAWFTLGATRQGAFHARSTDGGRSFTPPAPIGRAERQAGRPYLLADGKSAWLAWKEFDGTRSSVWVRGSTDSGRTWSPDRKLAETVGYADHPVLVQIGRQVHLSWMTREEGYRLLPVAARLPGMFTRRSYAAISARYAGKPLVVHLWGITCGPCVEELPRLAALKRMHPEMNLVLIQVEPLPVEAGERMLGDAGLLDVEHWHVSEEPDERLRHSIDPTWAGDMPRTLLISGGGTVSRIQGATSMERIESWLSSAGAARR